MSDDKEKIRAVKVGDVAVSGAITLLGIVSLVLILIKGSDDPIVVECKKEAMNFAKKFL